MDYSEKKLRRINRYEGIIVNLEVDKAQLPTGREVLREVVEHPGGVCVLPVDENGVAYCVRQFRYPMRQHLLEAPAGKLEQGEDPLACAARELSEETGFEAGRMIPLGSYYTSPGYSTELLHLYLGLDLRRGQAHPDEGELLDLERVPYAELLDMVERGEILDGKTAIAVLQSRRHVLKQEKTS